jgi:hypothetical protein
MCSLVAPLFFLFFFWLGWTTCGSEWPTRISRPLITTGKQKRMRDGWEGVVVLGPFWLFFFFGSFAYISFRTATINIISAFHFLLLSSRRGDPSTVDLVYIRKAREEQTIERKYPFFFLSSLLILLVVLFVVTRLIFSPVIIL